MATRNALNTEANGIIIIIIHMDETITYLSDHFICINLNSLNNKYHYVMFSNNYYYHSIYRKILKENTILSSGCVSYVVFNTYVLMLKDV